MIQGGGLLRTGGIGSLAATACLALFGLVPAATAQDIKPPESYQPTDANGVNLATGSFSVSTVQIGVGPQGSGGLSYSATFDANANAWRHSIWGGVDRQPDDPNAPLPAYTVTVMGRSVVFERLGATGVFQAVDGYGTLTLSGNIYTFTDLDGTVATFDKAQPSFVGYDANEGVVQEIVRPDGERITFTYVVTSSGPTVSRRPLSVTNNLGYQLHFDYPVVADTLANFTVTALNNGVDACAPTAATCSFSRTWPSLTVTRNATTRERAATDNLGRALRLGFSTTNRLATVARPSRTSGWSQGVSWVASPNRIQTVSDGVGVWTYAIPAPPGVSTPGTTSTVTDPNGAVTTYVFRWEVPDAGVRIPELRSITDGLNQTTQIIQDGGGLRSATFPEGNGVVVQRNGRGDVIGVVRNAKPGSGLASTSVTATYGNCSNAILCGRPTAITDARGATSDFTWDATHGGLLTATRPAPAPGAVRPQTRTSYAPVYAWYRNAAGTLVQAPTPVWRPTGTSACATQVSCAGTADEVVTYTTYQAGSASAWANALPLTQTSGSGDGLLLATVTTAWDANGDAVTVDGPLVGVPDITRAFYDSMRQPLGQIGPDPDGAGPRLYPATRTTYNADGQPVTVQQGTTTGQTDAAWAAFTPLQTATTEYDLQGRKAKDVAFSGSANPLVTQYSYDAEGRLSCTAVRMNPASFAALPASACAAAGSGAFGPDRITMNAYDAADRLTSVMEAFGTSVQRTALTQVWTTNGKVDWVEDANGNRSDYTYDGFDRLSRLYFPMPTTGSHAANPADYEAYEYDANDNPTAKITRAGLSFVSTFDALNRLRVLDAPAGTQDAAFLYDNLDRRTAAYIPGGGPSYAMTWDALGRQTSETGPLGTMASQYDLAGRRTRLTWPDAFHVTYERDLDGAMTAIRQGGSSLITGYSYDDLGRRTGVTRGNGATTSYGYDPASRLATLAHDLTGSGSDVAFGFGYTPASQITARSISNAAYVYQPAQDATAYVNNGLNQATSAGGLTLVWNAQGNLTSDGVRPFTYDAANRLTGTTGSALTYDPLDRLYQMTGTGGGRFQYDGAQVAAVYPAASSTVAERYIAGPGPDEWAAVYTGAGTGSVVWPLQDQQGSVIALSDATGAATSVLAYDEYGRPRAGNIGRFQYTGQMMLPDYGLQHYKARAYNAGLGRFVQADPVGYEQGLNLYAYVANDPVNATDPEGRQTVPGTSGMTLEDWRRAGEAVREAVGQAADAGGDVVGGVADFIQNYRSMREANVIGADKYFHCRANCEAASRGPAGEATARIISDGRELVDQATGDTAQQSRADQQANEQGRSGAAQNPQQCEATCSSLRPSALPSTYGPQPAPPPPPRRDDRLM